ncbi:MAG: DUF1330 domain-containing protein [Candidatus Binatia bacterium]
MRYGFNLPSRGPVTRPEQLITIVVLEFPSMEQAKAWYNDPAYTPMIKLRQSGSDAEIVLVEGL